jgi:hypothetical protein
LHRSLQATVVAQRDLRIQQALDGLGRRKLAAIATSLRM